MKSTNYDDFRVGDEVIYKHDKLVNTFKTSRIVHKVIDHAGLKELTLHDCKLNYSQHDIEIYVLSKEVRTWCLLNKFRILPMESIL